MKNTALITGASNGIGLELAKIHAAQGDHLVLVARSESKLKELKMDLEKQFNINVAILAVDLSEANAAQAVYDYTSKNNITVQYLINNAGFGGDGLFATTAWEKEMQMIQLNITTLTHLTKLYLQEMVKRGTGKIMNVASTAAFQPGPNMAVYCATKAFVLSFTEALSSEVSDKGITVTALCPGATSTGFQTAGGLDENKLFKNKNLPSAKAVASYGYRAMMKGKVVAIHGIMNYIMANTVRFIPRSLVLKVSRNLLGKA
ncbi:MAG: hypothetical protein RLY16_1550 [Bacteroidota bacterium]|jgi:short-subunit dehydrogenase